MKRLKFMEVSKLKSGNNFDGGVRDGGCRGGMTTDGAHVITGRGRRPRRRGSKGPSGAGKKGIVGVQNKGKGGDLRRRRCESKGSGKKAWPERGRGAWELGGGCG